MLTELQIVGLISVLAFLVLACSYPVYQELKDRRDRKDRR